MPHLKSLPSKKIKKIKMFDLAFLLLNCKKRYYVKGSDLRSGNKSKGAVRYELSFLDAQLWLDL